MNQQRKQKALLKRKGKMIDGGIRNSTPSLTRLSAPASVSGSTTASVPALKGQINPCKLSNFSLQIIHHFIFFLFSFLKIKSFFKFISCKKIICLSVHQFTSSIMIIISIMIILHSIQLYHFNSR